MFRKYVRRNSGPTALIYVNFSDLFTTQSSEYFRYFETAIFLPGQMPFFKQFVTNLQCSWISRNEDIAKVANTQSIFKQLTRHMIRTIFHRYEWWLFDLCKKKTLILSKHNGNVCARAHWHHKLRDHRQAWNLRHCHYKNDKYNGRQTE